MLATLIAAMVRKRFPDTFCYVPVTKRSLCASHIAGVTGSTCGRTAISEGHSHHGALFLRYYPQRLEVEEAIADQRKEAARALSTAADCAVSRGAADAVRKCICDSFCVLHDHRICDGDIRVPAYTWASTDVTILAVGAVTLRFAGSYWQILQLDVMSHSMSFLAMVLVMIAMLFEVLRARTASTDLVIGAVCLYFLIGLAWTFLYYSIYLLSPNSIFAASGTAALTAAGSEVRFTEVFYFSLSALTTIGSSNEEQLSTMVRQLAVVESAMGQLYLAVLISRLVGFSTTSDAKAAS